MSSQFYFDKALARAAVEFFPRFLRLTIGEWAGRPFELAPWQAHHTGQMFGWRRTVDGTRRYRRVRGFVPKGAGKTEWFAGIGHLLTVADNEPGAEVFCYGRDLSQGSIIFNRACSMVALDRDFAGNAGPLAELYEPTRTSLFCPHLMSTFKPIAGDPTGKHGPSVHGALGDEAHEWKDGTLHRFLVAGMGKRRQPLDAIITTAGRIKTYAHELYEDAKAILADPALDPECYVFIYEASADDDWTSPDVHKRANPNYGLSPKVEFMASQCREAQRNPRLENDFKRYHLGLWTEQTTRWFQMHRWRDNTAAPDDPDLWKGLPDQMAGRVAFGGIDLASIEDIAALVWIFPPDDPLGRWVWVPRFFVPSATVAERDRPAHPYRSWVRSGALIETPGSVIDYGFIEKQVKDDAQRYRLTRPNPKHFSIAIDRWNATQVTVNLRNEGLPVAMFGQGYASMGAPSREVERLYGNGQLEHGNHPLLKWMFGNAIYRRDPAGNIKPDKEYAAEKIDGLVAGIMGTGLACASLLPGLSLGQRLDQGEVVL